jgi:tRNA/tmRNA/rRNA uracil-C5-methylase (TrmA/RlmC/RlmD family)
MKQVITLEIEENKIRLAEFNAKEMNTDIHSLIDGSAFLINEKTEKEFFLKYHQFLDWFFFDEKKAKNVFPKRREAKNE